MTEKNKTIKTKTQPYKYEHCTYYLVSKKSKLNKKGIKKKRGEQLVLRTRDSYRSTYPELPNGKYYEYQIYIDAFLLNKPCKKYYLQDTKQNHKHFLGVEIFESIDPKYIGKNNNHSFHVKGGVVTFEHESELRKSLRESLYK
jgi:hypothetical protein